jgi:Stress responsive A/B Barrel Domain
MLTHVVLFRPKKDVTPSARRAMLDALGAAATGIPSVRRFHIGARVTHGRPYEQAMTEDYPHAAIIEFDDLAGLQAYLQHPAHQKLGELFYELLEAGLVYDYEMGDPSVEIKVPLGPT